MAVNNSLSNVGINEFTTFHELGHCVIWWAFGLILLLVSVVRGKDANGIEYGGICKSYFQDCSKAESVTHRMFTAQYVYGLFAGRAATEALCPEIPPGHGHANDFEQIKNLRALDADVIKMHQWRINNPDADTEAFYQAFKTPVLNIIKSKRGKRAILALSQALSKHGQLSGREAARILEESWGDPLPKWVIPFEQHGSMVESGPQSFNDLMNKTLIYVGMLKKDVAPLRDSEKNTPAQNDILERISEGIAMIQFLASVALPEKK